MRSASRVRVRSEVSVRARVRGEIWASERASARWGPGLGFEYSSVSHRSSTVEPLR